MTDSPEPGAPTRPRIARDLVLEFVRATEAAALLRGVETRHRISTSNLVPR